MVVRCALSDVGLTLSPPVNASLLMPLKKAIVTSVEVGSTQACAHMLRSSRTDVCRVHAF